MSYPQNKKPAAEITAAGFPLLKWFCVYRKNVKKLPGQPDIVLSKYRTAIFVNGCYWHGHEGCKYFVMPKTNIEFWKNKIEYNQGRDKVNCRKLEELGWNVLLIWECEIRYGDKDKALQELAAKIKMG